MTGSSQRIASGLPQLWTPFCHSEGVWVRELPAIEAGVCSSKQSFLKGFVCN